MALCENAFCTSKIEEFEYVVEASRKFCCVACAEDWLRQNEALVEAAEPFKKRPSRHVLTSRQSGETHRQFSKS